MAHQVCRLWSMNFYCCVLTSWKGTGKTMLVKAVAHHTTAAFIRVNGSEFVQKYLGEGPRMVRDVFRLARHLNDREGREVIPVTTIERPPSAELRADQRDDQSLPPYEVLDAVLEAYVELDRSREELEEQFDPEVVERTLTLVDRAEYKRRQAAPGVKLRPRAFGRDWRTPITNRWRG